MLDYMAASENGLSDLLGDMDLEETYDIGLYERDMDVEIIDGFYYQNERNVQRL